MYKRQVYPFHRELANASFVDDIVILLCDKSPLGNAGCGESRELKPLECHLDYNDGDIRQLFRRFHDAGQIATLSAAASAIVVRHVTGRP